MSIKPKVQKQWTKEKKNNTTCTKEQKAKHFVHLRTNSKNKYPQIDIRQLPPKPKNSSNFAIQLESIIQTQLVMKNPHYQFCLLLTSALILMLLPVGCNVQSAQMGRALGKGKVETSFTIPVYWAMQGKSGDIFITPLNEVFTGKIGLSDRVDVGLSLNYFAPLLFGRIQLLGDMESKTALSIGAGGFGANMYGTTFSILQVPLFYSVKASEHSEWFFNPRLTLFQTRDSKSSNRRSSFVDFNLNTGVQYQISPRMYFNISTVLGYNTRKNIFLNSPAEYKAFYLSVGLGITARFGGSKNKKASSIH